MLKDVDPVCDRERGRQYKEYYQFYCGDAEQKEIGKSSLKHVRGVWGSLEPLSSFMNLGKRSRAAHLRHYDRARNVAM